MATYDISIDDASSQTKAEERFYNPRFYALDFKVNPPSVANLPAEMEIYGVTVTPTVFYNASQAGASTWAARGGYGESLALAGNGTAPTTGVASPLLFDGDFGVQFNGSGGAGDSGKMYYGGTTLGNVTTEDLVVELVAMVRTNIIGVHAAKKESPAETGWCVYNNGLSVLLHLANGSTNLGVTLTLEDYYTYYHMIWFCDRSGSGVGYLNGAVGTPQSLATVTGSLSNSRNFAIGGYYSNDYRTDATILHFGMWRYPNWLNSHLQPTVASERFAQLCGTKALVSLGSAYPTTCSRGGVGYVDKIESTGYGKLYQVGSNWPRGCSRKDTSGNVKRGVLIEQAITNIGWHTEASGSWTMEVGLSAVPSTSVTLPTGRTSTTCVVHEDSSNGEHRFYEQTSLGADNTRYCMSVYAKAINRTKFGMYGTNSGCILYGGIFTLTGDGTATAVYGGTIAGILRVWGDWYRCWVAATSANPVVGGCYNRVYLYDDDELFQGLDQDSMAFWGFQVEPGGTPTSYIQSSAGASSRLADCLKYAADMLPSTGARVQASILVSPTCEGYTTNPRLFMLHDGTINNRMDVLFLSGAEAPYEYIAAGGEEHAAIQGTTDCWDGDEHTILAAHKTNLAQLYVDGVKEGTDDTSVIVPVTPYLNVGSYLSAGYELNALISKVRID